jgi:hypothetical protein
MEPISTNALARLLRLEHELTVLLALKPLRSVVHISEVNGLVCTLHASFSDYVLSQSRSGQFFCNPTQHNQLVSLFCFDLMRDMLRFNICDLESSYNLDKDVPDLIDRITQAITPQLFYACRYWCYHMKLAEQSSEICASLDAFLSNRLLSWMEVLSLKGCIGAGDLNLSQAYSWLEVCYFEYTLI